MRLIGCLAFAAFSGLAVASLPAYANMCRTEHMTCATTMPVDGFCECAAHGQTEDGTVFAKSEPHQHVDSSAGGCGAHPGAPGCR